MSENSNIEAMRHSLSHIMAAAVKHLFSDKTTVQFGTGPAVENGFYYDIDLGDLKLSEEDFPKIEKEMRKIIEQKLPIVRSTKSREDALAWARENGQKYKVELIEDMPEGEEISFYTLGDFEDLCAGPHVEDTGKVGAFKILRVSGAFWRADESREQMTRLFAVAFATKKELDDYLKMLEEAKKRDHRKLGKELDLFCFSDLVGAGLPMFTPRGTVLREQFAEFSLSLRARAGFQRIWTPHITKIDLYEKSGHYEKFGDELFMVNSQVNGESFALKPMNCPHHTQIFASKPRTYREMPVRYMEATTDYRDEKTGELGGLSRVRSLTQDDSHAFCRVSQIEDEVKNLVAIVKELYEVVGMSNLRARLSYRDDSDQYLGDEELWKMAQGQIKQAAIANNLEYFEAEGEAAFYGPKIDFMAQDAIGREHQLATIQLDFVQPERFGLKFTNEDGKDEQPVMIHHATLGSIERFLSVYIEHTAGKFPVWCSPEQLRIIKVKDEEKLDAFVAEIIAEAEKMGVRIELDDSNNSVGKKIRSAEKSKVPYSVVVGEKEVESGVLPVRIRGDLKVDDKPVEYSVADLMAAINRESAERSRTSTL